MTRSRRLTPTTTSSIPARKRRKAMPRIERICPGRSTRPHPSAAGPTRIPAVISTTTLGSRTRGKRPSRNGAAKAISATTSRLAKDTAGIIGGGTSPAQGSRFARADGDFLQPDLAPPLAEMRVDPDFPIDDVESERGAQRKQWRASRPRLGAGGGRVLDRCAGLFPRKTREDFRQAILERLGSLDQHQRQVGRLFAVAVAAHPLGDECSVVGPDRAVVVLDWVVTGVAGRHRSDPPAGEHLR